MGGYRERHHLTEIPWYQKEIKMAPEIRSTTHGDIGGDEQRMDDYNNQYNNLALKYVMLPVWLSAYRYSGKRYQVSVNAY